MKHKHFHAIGLTLAAMALAGQIIHAATPVPLALPSPDGKPGDTTKPVKVYILAGQSNMVGMGDITGARPPYPNLFLSADPAIIPGMTRIGGEYDGKPIARVPVARHGVFEAKAAVYAAPDELSKPPIQTAAVALGTVSQNLPTRSVWKSLGKNIFPFLIISSQRATKEAVFAKLLRTRNQPRKAGKVLSW